MTYKFTVTLSPSVTVEFTTGSLAEGAGVVEQARALPAFSFGANVDNQPSEPVTKPRGRPRAAKEDRPNADAPAPLNPPAGAATGNVPGPAAMPGVVQMPQHLQNPAPLQSVQPSPSVQPNLAALPGLPSASPQSVETLASRVLAEIDRRAPDPAASGPWIAMTAANAGLIHPGTAPQEARNAIAMMTDAQVQPLATLLGL